MMLALNGVYNYAFCCFRSRGLPMVVKRYDATSLEHTAIYKVAKLYASTAQETKNSLISGMTK